ncbi:MAG: alpha/beta fold hydrolase [Chthoniobacteraceae bacterium]
MKSIIALGTCAVLLLGFRSVNAATNGQNPAGHWEGAINLPNAKLSIRIDLAEADGKWTGEIDIPVQGLRDFALGDVKIVRAAVSFKMPRIPGDPAFAGELAADGKCITGTFTQNARTFPFEVSRTTQTATTGETPSKGVAGGGFAGIWQGSLHVNLMELRLLLKLEGLDANLAGTLDSLDQNANGIPITRVNAEGKRLHFEVRSIAGIFDGIMGENGSEIAGEWQQNGQKMPLVFQRLEKAPDLSRPQDPKKPYPYLEEEIAFTNAEAGLKLAGTFTCPKTKGPHPAVVLLTGSGPQDRDEALMGHRPFLVLADHLTRQGIAVLRFDDRGIGKSEGRFSQATNTDFVSDALAAVAWLKGRPEVNGRKIGLVGHSEGGITAPRAAVQSPDVAFIVLLAGVGVPMEELLLRQATDLMRVMGASDETIARQNSAQAEIFRIFREEGASPEAQKRIRNAIRKSVEGYSPEQLQAFGFSEATVEGQIQMISSPWFAEIFSYVPRPVLKEVKCPVLAINGEKDIQVAANENLSGIAEAVKSGGNQQVTTIALPGLNHLFQACTTGAMSEYGQIDETFNPKALDTVSKWIRAQAGL